MFFPERSVSSATGDDSGLSTGFVSKDFTYASKDFCLQNRCLLCEKKLQRVHVRVNALFTEDDRNGGRGSGLENGVISTNTLTAVQETADVAVQGLELD